MTSFVSRFLVSQHDYANGPVAIFDTLEEAQACALNINPNGVGVIEFYRGVPCMVRIFTWRTGIGWDVWEHPEWRKFLPGGEFDETVKKAPT